MACLLFQLTAMTPPGKWRSVDFRHSVLAATYRVMQTIAQQGDTLLEVTLIDDEGYLRCL